MKFHFLALVILANFAFVCAVGNASPKMYSATATADIRSGSGGAYMPRSLAESTSKSTAKDMVKWETAEILSDQSLNLIVHHLKLDRTWSQQLKSSAHVLTEQEAIGHLRSVVHIDFPNWSTFVQYKEEVGSTPPSWYVLVDPLIFKITADSEAPQEAADIANAVVNTYKAKRDREEAARNQHPIDTIKEQIAAQEKVTQEAKAVSARTPTDQQTREKLAQAQSRLGVLKMRLNQMIADNKLIESPVRILSRAVPPPE